MLAVLGRRRVGCAPPNLRETVEIVPSERAVERPSSPWEGIDQS